MLHIAFKGVNDTTDPDDLILTLFVFGTYPHIVIDSPPSAF